MVFKQLRLKMMGNDLHPSGPVVQKGQKPSKKDIYRNRNNFGVNFGSCFVLEKWIYPSLFQEGGDTELEAVQNTIKHKGKEAAKEKLENHWNNYVTEDDWKWLQDNKVTSVRLPIGYWEVDGGQYTSGTQFEKVKDIYENAWSAIKKIIEKANEYDISIVIGLHGLPGSVNGQDHNGEPSGGKANFWSNSSYQILACDMLKFIAHDLKDQENLVGIQVDNESEFSNDAKAQKKYYAAALNSIRELDSTIPVVISDGWWPNQWVKWIQKKQQNGLNLGYIVDDHVYRCFSDSDKNKSPQQIINELDKNVLTNLDNGGQGVDFMVGEYSCVLDEQSWSKDNAGAHRDELVKQYGQKQLELFHQRATFGSYFWTFKFESGNGGEWDFKTMVGKGAISSPNPQGSDIPDESAAEKVLQPIFDEHVQYWNAQNSSEKYEHERYRKGFLDAWKDSIEFANFNNSLIGKKQAWKSTRFAEAINRDGESNFLWEWEQGFETGLAEFRKAFK